MVAGLTGAATGTVVENTITKQQMLKSGPIAAVKDMYQEGGLRRFWKTYSHIGTRDGIFAFFMFTVVPEAEKHMDQKNYTDNQKLLSGFLLCIAGAALSHPSDIIATRIQESHGKVSTREMVKTMYNESGYKGFFKGLTSRSGLFFVFVHGLPEMRKLIDHKINSLDQKIVEPEFTYKKLN